MKTVFLTLFLLLGWIAWLDMGQATPADKGLVWHCTATTG